MRVLHLTLKKKWFDMIASGEKKEEYREIKPYWFLRLVFQVDKVMEYFRIKKPVQQWVIDRLFGNQITLMMIAFNPFDIVSANNGYAKDCPNIKWQHKGIRIGEGKPEWGAVPGVKYFILEIGELIKQ